MLTKKQEATMHVVGAEIGHAWARIGRASGVEPDPDYDFSGDHDYVRDRAVAAGIAWEGHQPDEDALEVWRAVREGYLAAIGGLR